MLLLDERTGTRLVNYCEKCRLEYRLPDCANYLFQNLCEVCGLPSFMVYFHGGICLLERKKEK